MAIVNNTAHCEHLCTSTWVPVFRSLGYMPRNGIVGSNGNFMSLWETAKLFSIAATPFYISTSNVRGFQFPHIFNNICYLPFFIIAILKGMKWYLIIVLVCISLMTNDVEMLSTFSYAYLTFIYLLWRNVYSSPLPIFLNKFIYFWLCWLFVAACGLSLVAVSGGYSSLQCTGFSLQWFLLLRSMGCRHAGFSSCGTWAQ